MPDVELESGSGKPVKVSLGLYVIIQLVLSCTMFGAGYATVKRDISDTQKAVEELKQKNAIELDQAQDIIRRLIRIEERMDVLREESRGRRR